jgi:uncharacterized protein YueI
MSLFNKLNKFIKKSRGASSSTFLKGILYNRILMYFILFLCIVNMTTIALLGDFITPVVFILVGVITAYFNKNIRFLDKVKQEDFFTLIPPLKIKKNDLYLKINNEIKKSQKKTVINNEKYFKRIYFIMSSKAGYKLEELYINEEISKKKFINKEN